MWEIFGEYDRDDLRCGFLKQLVLCKKRKNCGLLVLKLNMRRGWRFKVKHRKNGRSLVVPPPPLFLRKILDPPLMELHDPPCMKLLGHKLSLSPSLELLLSFHFCISAFSHTIKRKGNVTLNCDLGCWSSYYLLEIQVMYTTCLSPNMYV